jgi:UDPglucose 6-dehydrogenase
MVRATVTCGDVRAVPARTPLDAARGAHAIVLATDWPEFKTLELTGLKEVMRGPCLVDGRGLVSAADARAAGFHYYGFGRGGAERN